MIFPGLEKLREKRLKAAAQPMTKEKMLMLAVGFFVVGFGLLLCIPLGLVDAEMNDGVVAACGAFSVMMGVRHMILYRKG